MSVNQTDASGSRSADLADLHNEAPLNDSPAITVKFEEVSAAAFKIRGAVERTPCNVSAAVK